MVLLVLRGGLLINMDMDKKYLGIELGDLIGMGQGYLGLFLATLFFWAEAVV